jgi:DNA-binding transcriptional regulator LsrR (DeoR family)
LGCINPAHVRPGLQLRDVPAILAAYEGGETQGSIARRYGCTRPVICRLIAVHRAREVMA